MNTFSFARGAIYVELMTAVPTALYAAEPTLVEPNLHVVDQSLTSAESQSITLAARRYYTFWHTGDADYAQAALAENFIDLNLPAGRPQGPNGPLMASRQFRKAVPNLSITVEEMLIVGDRAVGRLRFKGNFTGIFNGRQGSGQAIDFAAVDIYRIRDGKIIENWHLEDNLTLLKQLETIK